MDTFLSIRKLPNVEIVQATMGDSSILSGVTTLYIRRQT